MNREDETPVSKMRCRFSTYTELVWARRDRTVALVALFVLWLVCAVCPPIAAAAVPSWHRERPLPQAVGSGARVAITSAGHVAVAWQDAEQGLSVALRPAGGRFGSPQRLSRSGRWVESPESLDLVADSRGRLVVVWGDAECCHVPGDRRVWASTRGAGGRFSSPVALSEPIHEVGSPLTPVAAVGEGGSLTVVWSSDTRSPAGLAGAVIEAADRLPGGGFGPPARLSPLEGRAYQPRVARGPSGETVVLWSSEFCLLPCHNELQAATRPPGGRFGAPELVAVPDQSGYPSKGLTAGQVQIASDGTVVALWTQWDLCFYCYGADVKAAKRPPGQRFGSAQTLGHLGGSGPWLALDAHDRALALWGDANTDRFAVDLHPRVFGALAPPHAVFARGRPLERGGDALGIAPGVARRSPPGPATKRSSRRFTGRGPTVGSRSPGGQRSPMGMLTPTGTPMRLPSGAVRHARATQASSCWQWGLPTAGRR